MSMFEERERGYEAKWARDEETFFRIAARRDTGLGEWAAALMKFPPAESADYVEAVIQTGMTGKGPDPALEKIYADFTARGVGCSVDELLLKAKALREEAEAHFR
jgi:hypothetical protein